MASGFDALLQQINQQEATQRNKGSQFFDAFTQSFQRGTEQKRDFQNRSKLEDQKLQNELMLQQFQQDFKQQQNQAMFDALKQTPAVQDSKPPNVETTTGDKDQGEVSVLEKRMESVQEQIDQLSVFAGNPAAKSKIDSLREEQKRVQKRIDRVRDRKLKREDDFNKRVQDRIDKLHEIEGASPIDPQELEGLSDNEKINYVNERIRLSKSTTINGTDAVRLQSAKQFASKAEDLIKLIKKTGDFTEILAQLKISRAFSKDAQQLNKLLFDLSDRLLRARTGATARPDEVENTKALLVDIFSDDETNVTSLNAFIEEMKGIVQNLETGKAVPPGQSSAPTPMQNPGPLPPQSQEALQWARNNPNDPRAAKILQKLGVR